MSLTRPSTGNTIAATHITQFCDILQRQSSQTEIGKYFMVGSSYTTNANFSNYIVSLSRGSVPVSVSIDEADQSHSAAGGNCNPAITAHLTANGFEVNTSGTAAFASCQVGGNWTITY